MIWNFLIFIEKSLKHLRINKLREGRSVIVTKNLTKFYRKKDSQNDKKQDKIIAVDHLNLEIKKGEIFGLIGPNGAGKTTLLKMLSTLILPDEGTALIEGYDIVNDANEVKNKVSLLAGEFVRSLYWRLSGRQNLKFFANLRNMWNPDDRIDELIELFHLKNYENELVMKYSTGMKHKLAFAVGLLSDPPVIFLDEPLTGIDPVVTYEIKNIIKKDFRNKTIIWTTHNLYEVEEMCNRIAIINNGRIYKEGSPEKLMSEYWGYDKIMIVCDNAKVFSSFSKVEIKGNVVEIETNDLNETLAKIMEIVKQNKVSITKISTMKPTLEEIFMKGIGNA